MGQQNSFPLPIVKNNPINFVPQIHQFESESIQRVKQTPFIGSVLYSSQPTIYIEHSQMTLQALLAPRMNTTKLFPKQEIIKIIENVLTGLNELKTRNFQHYGNLSLESIFYHKPTKAFKIINPAFFDSTNYFLAREKVRFSFLSPQQLLNITQEDEIEVRSYKTDIFILAVCLLQVCTLKDSRNIYCPETYNILDVEVQERLKSIAEFYTPELATFIELCLEYEFQKRIDLEDAIKQVKYLKEKPVREEVNIKSGPQVVGPLTQVSSPKSESRRGSLPFGPSHLPKKLPQGP